MRAFIIRSHECIEFLNSVETDEDCYFDQDYYLRNCSESFHGVIVDDLFKFEDKRLPNISIPLVFVEIER